MNDLNIPMREYIFASMFALSNRLQKLGDRLNGYMTIKQWMLIAVIEKSEKQELPIGEVAAIIGSSHQNVKKMAIILQKQGFLTLTKHPDDGRSTLLSITDYCKDYFIKRAAIEEAFLHSIFQGFSAENITGLYNGLRLLQGNIEMLEEGERQ